MSLCIVHAFRVCWKPSRNKKLTTPVLTPFTPKIFYIIKMRSENIFLNFEHWVNLRSPRGSACACVCVRCSVVRAFFLPPSDFDKHKSLNSERFKLQRGISALYFFLWIRTEAELRVTITHTHVVSREKEEMEKFEPSQNGEKREKTRRKLGKVHCAASHQTFLIQASSEKRSSVAAA